MATEQVLNWIGGATTAPGQEPIKLSKTINSFETDFSNGYLFGEILVQNGIIENMNGFSKKTNKEAKVQNFYFVEDALRYLKVPFDAKLTHKIMSEERGASLRLLYQVKLALDRHYQMNDLTVTNIKKSALDSKVKNVKDLATSLPKIHKQYGVEGPTHNSVKLDIIEKKLLKYELARVNLEKDAHDGDVQEVNMLRSMQQTKRQEAMRVMKENKSFNKEWENEGKQNWKTNRETRAKEIARQQYFDDREVTIYQQNLHKQLEHHTTDMIAGVDQFHENMQKLGIEQNISIQDAIQRQEEKKGIPPGQIQNFSYAATMNKIKETKNNNEFAGKERERRNRKMLVDQRKIQETLDAKKEEEMRIQRLLERQTKEKNEAITRERQQLCESIVIKNRQSKATTQQKDRILRTEQIEQEMKKLAIEAEDDRQNNFAKARDEYKINRKLQKAQKRHINIEIASELVDLIMDVADEAFDFQETQKDSQQEEDSDEEYGGKLLSKAVWRQWMDIFTQGKKVSEQNIVIKEDDTAPGEGPKQLMDSMAQLLTGSSAAPIHPYKLLNDIKSEPIYDDFMGYICMTGPLNLRLVAADKWHSFKDIVQKDKNLQQRNFNLEFLNEIYVPKNQDLGRFIEKLYMKKSNDHGMSLMATKKDLPPPQIHQAKFPTHHSIKLCLIGKAHSGKKTQAKMIVDQLGSEKVQIFDMGEIIREACAYIDPNKATEEVVDPKAKGKGKAVEAPVDPYAGKDTTLYKEIGTLILQQIQQSTGDENGVPGKDVDIQSLIGDDQLLVQLFTQKLLLTYDAEGQSAEQKEQALVEKIEKEKELLEQLEEAKANEGADADPKGKKGSKAAKSPAEVQDELKQLLAPDINGWVLVDFPRNLTQAKLLESAFTGYQSASDTQKPKDQQNFEVWSKFTEPSHDNYNESNGMIEAQPSLFDGMFILQASKEECQRRAQNRKMDPTTNTVYHSEDDPAPEGDAKLLDRLTPYYGNFASEEDMTTKLDTNHITFYENEPILTRFGEGFGMLDVETGQGLQACIKIEVKDKQNKDEIFAQVSAQITSVIAFKQIAESREYAAIKEKVIREEEEKAAAEALAAQKAEQESQMQRSDVNKSSLEKESKTPVDAENAVAQPEPELKKGGENMQSKASLHSKHSGGPISHSKLSSGGALSVKKMKKIDYTREYKINIWEQMETDYIKDGLMTISDIKRQRETVVDNLNQCQRQFIQFLERPCEKQDKVNDFVNSFNQFSAEFPDLRKDDQTKEELLNRLEQLSNTLWDITERRKDESIEQIRKMSQGGWSDLEMRSVCRNMASLIEIEIKKFETVYKILMQAEPPVELDAEILTKKLLERQVPTYDGDNGISPIFEQVLGSLLSKLDDLVDKNPIVAQIWEDPQGIVLQKEKQIFTYKLALINSWALAILEEIHTHSRQVYEQLDDWIVDAVSSENQISQSIIQVLKSAIQEEQIRIDEYKVQLQQLSLFNRIQTIHFSSTETPLYLRNVHIPSDEIESTRFSHQNLRSMYVEMRQSLGERGNINILDQQSFINIMLMAMRCGKIPLCWKYLNFDKLSQLTSRFSMQPLSNEGPQSNNESPIKEYHPRLGMSGTNFQAQGSRSWVNWKKIISYFALMNSPTPSEKELGTLRVKLTDAGTGGFISKKDFVAQSFWFDQYEGKPDAALEAEWAAEKRDRSVESEYDSEDDEDQLKNGKLDTNRLLAIKELLFDVHRVGTGEDKMTVTEFVDFFIEASNLAEENKQSGPTFGDQLFV